MGGLHGHANRLRLLYHTHAHHFLPRGIPLRPHWVHLRLHSPPHYGMLPLQRFTLRTRVPLRGLLQASGIQHRGHLPRRNPTLHMTMLRSQTLHRRNRALHRLSRRKHSRRKGWLRRHRLRKSRRKPNLRFHPSAPQATPRLLRIHQLRSRRHNLH